MKYVARGVHVSKDGGGVILYAPALKADGIPRGLSPDGVPYDEEVGVDYSEAMIRLASALRKGMTKEQLRRYGNFVDNYGNVSDALKAEEFLAELFADIAEGMVDIKFHKGIISGWVRFVQENLVGRGIEVSTPVLQDVASGIRDAAAFFAEGEGGAQAALTNVFDRAGELRFGLRREGLAARLEVRTQPHASGA